MVNNIEEKLGTDNYALIGDTLNATTGITIMPSAATGKHFTV